MNKRYSVRFTSEEHDQLKALVSKGKAAAYTIEKEAEGGPSDDLVVVQPGVNVLLARTLSSSSFSSLSTSGLER
jgi:hypothetical protein